jgi:putative transposase
MLQNVGFRYTGYINCRRNWTGHVFQNRCKAILIDTDSYLLELVRYIHNNPVCKNMVKTPEDFPWSGHDAYLGNHRIPRLTTDWVLSQFSKNRKESISSFIDFVRKGMSEGEQKEFQYGSIEGRILGDDHFAEKVLAKTSEKVRRRTALDQVIKEVCRWCGIDQEDLSRGSRQKGISEARTIVACP